MFQIEKNVPIPNGRSTKYPFADMKVGDSITVAAPDNLRAKIAAHQWARRNNAKFVCRTQRDGVMRIWRVS